MKHFHGLVYDEVISGAGAVTFTSLEWAQRLATYDQLLLFGVADNVQGGGGAVNVQFQVSGDGRLWVPKNGTSATIDLAIGPLAVNTTSAVYGWDSQYPLRGNLGFVQLQMTLVTSTSAHVKIYVTGRDQGGR